MNKNDIPQFVLTCIRTDYPNHLCLNVKYKIDITKKNDNEILVYWFHPIEYHWDCIGYFPLTCFDTTPVREWLNKKKGVEQRQPVRERVEQRSRI